MAKNKPNVHRGGLQPGRPQPAAASGGGDEYARARQQALARTSSSVQMDKAMQEAIESGGAVNVPAARKQEPAGGPFFRRGRRGVLFYALVRLHAAREIRDVLDMDFMSARAVVDIHADEHSIDLASDHVVDEEFGMSFGEGGSFMDWIREHKEEILRIVMFIVQQIIRAFAMTATEEKKLGTVRQKMRRLDMTDLILKDDEPAAPGKEEEEEEGETAEEEDEEDEEPEDESA